MLIFDPNADVRAEVAALGFADQVEETGEAAVANADLVLFAAPVGAIGAAAVLLRGAYAPGATLTDVGSCKAVVCEGLMTAAPAGVHVVPGHPVAGTERSGPGAGFAELFHNRWTILTPVASADPTYPLAVDRLATFWRTLGAKVETMDATHHDLVLAVTSHLPHLIAYNIVGTAADMETVTEAEVMKFSAGGFRDFTRIAASRSHHVARHLPQ